MKGGSKLFSFIIRKYCIRIGSISETKRSLVVGNLLASYLANHSSALKDYSF